MINVFQAVKTYQMGEPWTAAAAELALHPESGLIMKQGHYAIVAIGPTYVFPPVKFAFTSEAGVIVTCGEDFACFDFEGTRHCIWRTETLPESEPQIA